MCAPALRVNLHAAKHGQHRQDDACSRSVHHGERCDEGETEGQGGGGGGARNQNLSDESRQNQKNRGQVDGNMAAPDREDAGASRRGR
jgi:hypothetical protein